MQLWIVGIRDIMNLFDGLTLLEIYEENEKI